MWEPFGTTPRDGPAYWQTGPKTRGTFNILSDCIITLTLCVYTSLHLNIPEYGKSRWYHRSWQKATWVVVGILAPELVAYIAFCDWQCARNLGHDLDELLFEQDKIRSGEPTNGINIDHFEPAARAQTFGSNESHQSNRSVFPSRPARPRLPGGHEIRTAKRNHRWTHVHGYYAAMGGLTLDTSRLGIRIFDNRKACVLTPKALRQIASLQPSMLPDISEADILDKSKANILAKSLVCLQGAWFSAQFIGRLATSHIISLLELNTFLHAICCFLMYAAWWNKPLDIERPFLIDAGAVNARKFSLDMADVTRLECHPRGLSPNVKNVNKLYLVPDSANPRASGEQTQTLRVAENSPADLTFSFKSDDITRDLEDLQQDLVCADKDRLIVRLFHEQKWSGFRLLAELKEPKDFEDVYTELSPADFDILRHIQSRQAQADGQSMRVFKDNLDEMLQDKVPLIRWSKFRPASLQGADFGFILGVLAAAASYGGIHLLAWNGPFPTTTERWTWRVSCIIISSPICVVPLGGLIIYGLNLKRSDHARASHARSRAFSKEGMMFLVEAFPYILGVLYVLCYMAARVYLIVECFVNLAKLPPEVYTRPVWSQYIPHFGAG